MAAAAHNSEFAAKIGIPQKVAREFNQADAGTGILNKNARRYGGSKRHEPKPK